MFIKYCHICSISGSIYYLAILVFLVGDDNISMKYVGNGKLVDENGEIIPAPEVEEKTNENFLKMQVMTMATVIKHIGNKKMQVINYIMDHINYSNNILLTTQRELADKLGFSTKTVNETIKDLRKANILKTRTNAIMLSPELVYKGRRGKGNYMIFKFSHFNDDDTKLKVQKSTKHEGDKDHNDKVHTSKSKIKVRNNHDQSNMFQNQSDVKLKRYKKRTTNK